MNELPAEYDDDEYESVQFGTSQTIYSKLDKLKQANLELSKEKNITPKRKPRVRFSENVTFDDDDDDDDDEVNVGSDSDSIKFSSVSKKTLSKLSHSPTKLLVTVPTGFSRDSEDVLSDYSDAEEPPEVISNHSYGHFREEQILGGEFKNDNNVSSIHSEEEIEEDYSVPFEETLTSSTETVLYRSETEESELTEWFSKSIHMEPDVEEGETNVEDDEDEKKSLESVDLPSLFKNEEASVKEVDIDTHEETEEVRPNRPDPGFTVKIHRKPSIASDPGGKFSPQEKRKRPGLHNSRSTELRPSTAPSRRQCCVHGPTAKLPDYNGLRSEYGLSADQLQERERKKLELLNAIKLEKEQRYLEQKKKRKENEATFNNWLIKKKREAEAKAIRKLRQGNFVFRTLSAPTAHMDKIGILRRKLLKKETSAACFLLNELFRNAKPHEQKTYRIYLGLRTD